MFSHVSVLCDEILLSWKWLNMYLPMEISELTPHLLFLCMQLLIYLLNCLYLNANFSHFYPFIFFYIFCYNINILHFTPSLCRGCEPTATFTRTHPQQSYIYTSAVFSTVRAMLLKEIPYNIFLFCQTVLTLRHSPRVLLMPKDFLSF